MINPNLAPGALNSYCGPSTAERTLNESSFIITPWFITGLSDSEASFMVYKTPQGNYNFEIALSQKEHNQRILYSLQNYFNSGNVVWSNRALNQRKWSVKNRACLLNLIDFFEKYPLVTSKRLNFEDFAKILRGVVNDTMSADEIDIIIARINNKRTWESKFRSINVQSLYSDWVVGFIVGDGCFYAEVSQRLSRGKTYPHISLSLEVSQSSHDVAVLHSLKDFFESGYVSPKCNHNKENEVAATRSTHSFKCKNVDAVRALFDSHPLGSIKSLDYHHWCEISDLWRAKAQRTPEGYNRMLELKNTINSGRNK